MKELFAIQQALNVPKKHHNKFGNFYYRKTEDIMEAVKKLCAEHDCLLVVPFTVVFIEGRFYTKATAKLYGKSGLIAEAEGFAREPDSKPKMSPEQVTGSSSSYARKYALSGLFSIDDSEDPDSQDNTHLIYDMTVAAISKMTTVEELQPTYDNIQNSGNYNPTEIESLTSLLNDKHNAIDKGKTQ